MCCIACFVFPTLLWIFYRYIQPLILAFWNPWGKKGIEAKSDPMAEDNRIDLVSVDKISDCKYSSESNDSGLKRNGLERNDH